MTDMTASTDSSPLKGASSPRTRKVLVALGLLALAAYATAVTQTPKVQLTTSSNPPGIVSGSAYHDVGSTVSVSVPAAAVTSNSYRFAYWKLNGVRQVDALGISVNAFNFKILENSQVVAEYQLESADADADQVPDWYELRQYGDINQSPGSDTDEDGVTLLQEYEKGSQPRIPDSAEDGGIVDGGISRRRGEKLAVTVGAEYALYAESSTPPGVVSRKEYLKKGTQVSTANLGAEYLGHRFTQWTINGVRQETESGIARNQVSFVIAGGTHAVAEYLPKERDSDADALPDWYEMNQYGTLTMGPDSDSDEDGRSLVDEYASGTQPRIADGADDGGVVAGGVSRRRGEKLALAFDPLFVRYTESSIPGGIVSRDIHMSIGTSITTANAPLESNGYKFSQWLINGARQENDAGIAKSIVTFELKAETKAIAYYYSAGQDADADQIPDWYEIQQYGDILQGPDSDTDEDGVNLLTEYQGGTQPRVADSAADGGIVEGGVSRRRAEKMVINFSDVSTATLAILTPANGTVVGQGEYNVGATATLTATPGAGYIFSGWTGDASGAANPLSLTMHANKVVGATFEPDYTESDGDGLTNYAEAVTHYTNPNSPDSDWDGYSDGEEVERGSNPNSYWDKPRVLLSYFSNGGGNIEATGLDYGNGWGNYWYNYYEGYAPLRSIVTLTPIANNGYVFKGWFGDASGTSSPLNLQMDSSKSVQANFEPDYADADGDGLTNYEELAIYDTNPNASDTDDDGHSDAKEIQRGSDPSNSASIPEKLGNYIGPFDAISNKVYGASSFLINLPTASSGLPVVVSVKSGPAKIEGNRVRLTGAGIVVLAANQPGDEDYKAANEVTVSFAVLDLKNMTGEYVGNFNSEYFERAQEAMNRNGQLSMKLAKGGAFTGSMVILGSRISIRGKFDAYGAAEISVSSKTISGVFVDLSIEPMTETEFQVGASIRWSDETSSEFVCYPVAFTGTGGTNNFPLAGKQINSMLISQLLSGIDFGHGFAKIKISTNGTLTFAGRMADGSTVSGTSRLVNDEYGDLLAQASFPLAAVKGLLHGVAQVQTDPEEGQYHLASPYEWVWVRLPQSRARIFKEGFAEKVNVYGQVWNYTKGQSALPEGVDGFTFQVDPDSIVLEEPMDLWGSWPSSNKPTWDYMPKGFTFKVNPITGDISGTAPRTINGKATKAATYQGLLLSPGLETYDGSPLMGGGYILGAESSGVIELTAP